MNKHITSFTSFFHLFIICFLTVGTRSIIETVYPVRESISSLDVNVGIVTLIDFVYYLLLFISWGFIVGFFKKDEKTRALKDH